MKRSSTLLACAVALAGARALAQPCTSYWTRVGGVSDAYVYRLVTHDDGTGPALYVSCGITEPPLPSNGFPVSRWDGVSWEYLGEGVPANIGSFFPELHVLDLGSGPQLVMQGRLSNNTMFARRWDGERWVDDVPHLNTGTYGSHVRATITYDSGSGRELYGDVASGAVARWTGAEWVSIGEFDTSSAARWEVFDDGGGPRLYVLGYFLEVGGVPARHIACWDGVQWSPVGGGLFAQVTNDMCVFDSGQGDELYVAKVSEAGGVPMGPVVKWDGATWSQAGNLGDSGGFLEVYQMEVFDDGTGPALYAAGIFGSAGGLPARNFAKFDGQQWKPVGPGIGWPILDMVVHDDGRGESLFLGGHFSNAGGGLSEGLVQYVGCASGNCYADCDRDGLLSLADFSCYMTKFQARDPYANCNLDSGPGGIGINLADFGCFQTRFALGCP